MLVHRSRDPRGVVLGVNLTVERGRPEGPCFLLSFWIADLPLLPCSTMSSGRSTCLTSIKSNHAIGGRRRHAGAAIPRPGSSAEGRPRLGGGGTVVGELDSLPEDPGPTPTNGTRPPIIRNGLLRARCAAMAARGPPTNPWNQGSPGMGRWTIPIGVRVTSSGAWPVSCVGGGDGYNKFIPTALRYD